MRSARSLLRHDYNVRELLVKVFEVVLYAIVFLVMLKIVGIDLTALAVFGGAVGVGVGLGLQKIASNFISGIILLMGKSVRIGDIIEIEGTNVLGTVKNMGARNLLLERFDGKEILIPNEDLITTRVTNWTYSNNQMRADVIIGVSYDSDVELAQKIMIEAAKSHKEVVEMPERPTCNIDQFADSAITLHLFFWIEDVKSGRARIRSEVMLDIWKKFRQHGITIPYPQRDLYIKNLEELRK